VAKRASVNDYGRPRLRGCGEVQPHTLPPHGRAAAAAEQCLTKLPGGPGRGRRARQKPEDRRPERKVAFARELGSRADDFMEDPPKRLRLAPGTRGAPARSYFITCRRVKDAVASERSGDCLRPRDARRPAATTRGTPRRRCTWGFVARHAQASEVAYTDHCSRSRIRGRTASSWPISARNRKR